MKRCSFCKKKGFQAEKYFSLKHVPDKSICYQCGIEIYLMIREITEKRGAITGKLDPTIE